jgi:hypothetical protein
MQPDTNHLEEILALSPLLAGAPREMPYQVPPDYLETLCDVALARVAAPPHSMTVPDGYFNALPQQILRKLNHQLVVDELDTVAPALNSISKAGPYEVPAGYFEQLSPSTLAQPTMTIKPAKRIGRMVSWAAAAAVVITFGITAKLTWPNRQSAEPQVAVEAPPKEPYSYEAAALTTINDSDLATYAHQYLPSDSEAEASVVTSVPENFESALETFSIDDLEAHLSTMALPAKNG